MSAPDLAPQPRQFGRVHIVGIGGIGMSGIAEIMHNIGYEVQGSDLHSNANTQRLQDLGICVFKGHAAKHIDGVSVVTVSSAVDENNAEVKAARTAQIPVVRRAEMLAELMRLKPCITIAGTHGKTTTTSLTAAILDGAGGDPTVINGGIINAYGSNARLGQGAWMVVEADESDGTFVRLPSTIGVITNIDPEHLDHYGDFASLRTAFDSYIRNIPFYGVGIVCLDHPEVQALLERVTDRPLRTYGLHKEADLHATNIREDGLNQHFDVVVRDRLSGKSRTIKNLTLPMAGRHNLQNALAAIGVGLEIGIDEKTISKALHDFSGVKRRFTHIGAVRGVDIFDDYAHHPVEIAALLEGARAVAKNRVIAIVQPHRYSRLRDLFREFCGCMNLADRVVVLPVYAAGEQPIEKIDAAALVQGLREEHHKQADSMADADALIKQLQADFANGALGEGDVIVCMGAGDITAIANDLPKKLQEAL